MSASHLTMLGIPAYKSRTLIPDHLFLDPREYIYKWSVVSRVKNVMWHVFVETSMIEQSHEVQRLPMFSNCLCFLYCTCLWIRTGNAEHCETWTSDLGTIFSLLVQSVKIHIPFRAAIMRINHRPPTWECTSTHIENWIGLDWTTRDHVLN